MKIRPNIVLNSPNNYYTYNEEGKTNYFIELNKINENKIMFSVLQYEERGYINYILSLQHNEKIKELYISIKANKESCYKFYQ